MRLICQCLCLRLIDRTGDDTQKKNILSEEQLFLTKKAKSLSNFLFLKDDVFRIEALKSYQKKAITIQPLNNKDDFKRQQLSNQNIAKHIYRHALITVLDKVNKPIV
ncbi:unnamed protein product [Schistosoma turkestanicum]|nr:unnamed protein product [Schistosoma turkestanicum]